jgi:phosphoglycolate phosphatase
MTASSPAGMSLDDIITPARYLFLDFDGPVCQIFAGLPAPVVADRLRKLFTGPLPPHVESTSDPLQVFTYAATVSAELAARVEAEMTAQEQAAVPTAKPTPYVHEVLTSARESGRTIAVVSNNSESAVRAYLTAHGLDDRIDLVSARTSPNPGRLKPSPYLIEQAMSTIGAEPADCFLIGDSTDDITAAQRAGIASIGYANKPGKHALLAETGAEAVVSSLADIVLTLRARPLPN